MPDTLAVIVPSRGLMFSRTLEELLGELEGVKYKFFFCHGKPLPDAFNIPTQKALDDPSIYAILYCEDDMIIPKGILKDMFTMEYPVVALDYPFKDDGDSTVLNDPQGLAYWSGTGFLLVAKPLIENMSRPIWITDTAWDTMIKGDRIIFWPRKLHKIAYGLHDVNFGIILYSQGVPVKPMPRTAGQRKLVKLGQPGVNNGQHEIKNITQVGRDMVIKTMSEHSIDIFKKALQRVRGVEIRTDIPNFITYKDGQATVADANAEYI